MKKFLLLFFFTSTVLLARVDYSEMSTQELIAIMGYVKDENKKKFKRELNSRVPIMSNDEKRRYQNNMRKLNK